MTETTLQLLLELINSMSIPMNLEDIENKIGNLIVAKRELETELAKVQAV